MTFRKDEGSIVRKKFQLRIGNIRQYIDWHFSIGLERVKAIKIAYKRLLMS
jgi:hypothetical protein